MIVSEDTEVTVLGEATSVARSPVAPEDAAPVPSAADLGVSVIDEEDDYQHRLGSRLRAIRRSQSLRLQDVEERSGGRFKAVVVGSYERGDRAVSAHKLAALAGFYQVPVAELLPDDDWPRGSSTRQGQLSVSVTQLREQADDPEFAPLLRLVQHVQWLRDDYNGQVLSLRADDLRTVAVALGAEPDGLDTWLDRHGLLHR